MAAFGGPRERRRGPAPRRGHEAPRPGVPRVVLTQHVRCIRGKMGPYEQYYDCIFTSKGPRTGYLDNNEKFRRDNTGPTGGAPLMGYSARSTRWRYIAWFLYDSDCEAARADGHIR